MNRGCPLRTTITRHLAVATVLAAHDPGNLHPAAVVLAASSSSAGVAGLAVVLLVLALLATIARAARSLAALASEFLRVAAEMTSALLIMLLIAVLAVVLLIHR